MKTTIYLSLGSNLGDRAANLRAAVAALENSGVRVTRVSSFYETEPLDFVDQPWFLNCAAAAETELAPLALLRVLREIESRLGSKKEIPKGPRLLDMDILLYGNEIIDSPELQIPHPRMLLRKFVLVPLVEIAPNLTHPSWRGSVTDLLAATPDHSTVRRLAYSS